MELVDLPWQNYRGELSDDERCGIVLVGGEIVEIPNNSSYPRDSFVMSESDLEPFRPNMIATWHTHPRGPCNLSLEDYNTFMELPELQHLIITHKSVTAYGVEDDYVMNLARRKF